MSSKNKFHVTVRVAERLVYEKLSRVPRAVKSNRNVNVYFADDEQIKKKKERESYYKQANLQDGCMMTVSREYGRQVAECVCA